MNMTNENRKYLAETNMLNYKSTEIECLIRSRKWSELAEFEKIAAIYDFVQNEILFGYNATDYLTASEVLADGFGDCNTKATLIMALLRAVGIPCRLHASKAEKYFQKGAANELVVRLAPRRITHTWAEVFFDGRWVSLEGIILDKAYLSAVRRKYPRRKGEFKAYAIATDCFESPAIEWKGEDTFIQKEAVVFDYGSFVSPDDFYSQHKPLNAVRQFLYTHFGSRIMTNRVAKIRESGI